MPEQEAPMPVRYTVSEEEKTKLQNRYLYHAPQGDQAERYSNIRANVHGLASLIMELTPVSREQSLALTALDNAMFNANAAIARNEAPLVGKPE